MLYISFLSEKHQVMLKKEKSANLYKKIPLKKPWTSFYTQSAPHKTHYQRSRIHRRTKTFKVADLCLHIRFFDNMNQTSFLMPAFHNLLEL